MSIPTPDNWKQVGGIERRVSNYDRPMKVHGGENSMKSWIVPIEMKLFWLVIGPYWYGVYIVGNNWNPWYVYKQGPHA